MRHARRVEADAQENGMNLFELIALLLGLSATFAYLNARVLRLPTSIGVMAVSLVFSLALVSAQSLGLPELTDWAKHAVAAVDFDRTLLDGMLSVLLFAGALQVPLDDLGRQWRVIGLLATAGVVVCTALIGVAIYAVQGLLDLEIPFIYCLLFGAVISPTDPVAVLGIVQKLGLPQRLQTEITGESLFNDGFAVVVFLGIVGIASGETNAAADVAILFAKEVLGGIVLGLLLGAAGYWLLRSIDEYIVEVLITLALVVGGYALALRLHFSGPLAMVVAGLLLGNHGRQFAMSETTRVHLDMFWQLVDELLNIILFLLIGLELLVIRFDSQSVLLGLLAIPLVLLARFLAVGGVISALSPLREFDRGVIRILTWGGLRGGISVALALSLPNGPERGVIVTMTYVVVVFSVLIQGLTVAPLVQRLRDKKGDSDRNTPAKRP